MTTGGPGRSGVSPVGFVVIGSEMAAFTLIGLAIDWMAGSLPWATVVFTLLGLVAAMVHLVRLVSPKGPGGDRS